MNPPAALCLSGLIACLTLGCGSPEGRGDESGGAGSASGAGNADGGAPDQGSAGASGGGIGAPPLGFNPSNVGVTSDEADAVTDAIVIEEDCELFSESGEWTCVDPSLYVHRFETLPSGYRYSVFIVESLE